MWMHAHTRARVVRDADVLLGERYEPGGLCDDPESKVHTVFLIKPHVSFLLLS